MLKYIVYSGSSFNSRPREEATARARTHRNEREVSTHAPVRRRPKGSRTHSKKQKFQLTPP